MEDDAVIEVKLSEQELARSKYLLDIGLRSFQSLTFINGDIPSDKWAKKLRSMSVIDNLNDDKDLKWLWDILIRIPTISGGVGSLPAFGNTLSTTQLGDTIDIFSEGQSFIVGLKPISTSYPLKFEPGLNNPIIITKKPLIMKKGKAGRLECCSCESELKILMKNKDDYDKDNIAAKSLVDPTDISRSGRVVTITVKSLNHAYTVASRILEPKRRSHGGRVYDHIASFSDDGDYSSLESVRISAEKGLWEVPKISEELLFDVDE